MISLFFGKVMLPRLGILLSDLKLSNFRTKVECGGQCLATENCEAFEFIEDKDNKTCR